MRAVIVLCVFCSLVWSGEEVAATPTCHAGLRTDITSGTKFKNGSILHNNILYRPDKYIKSKNGTTISGCTCDVVPLCFRKCCPYGETYHGKTCMKSNHSLATNFKVPVHKGVDRMDVPSNHFTVVYRNYCEKGAYLLQSDNYEEDEHYLQVNGSLYLPKATDGNQAPYSPDQFCIDYFEDLGNLSALLCYPDDEKMQLEYSIGMILSLPFLLVTFLVHACVPELQNLHGKCLMCYVLTLLIAYVFLVIVQLARAVIMHEFCVTAPFIIYFAFMVSFMWLNVMCIDICVTFSGRRGYTGARLRGSEDKRFFVYSLYAWGIPLIMLIVVLILQFTPDLPASIITPKFGESKCWFPDDKSLGLFFYGPILLVILVNLGLFAYTTLKIWSIQRDTDKSMRNESQRHGDDTDKQRYKLYLKLMFVFGVNWLMEIVSWQANGPSWLWYVTDMCNALYGVLIFFIFVCKANVWKLVKKRYHVMMGRPYLASTFGPTSSTRSTGTSNLSTTDVGGVDSIALRSSANA